MEKFQIGKHYQVNYSVWVFILLSDSKSTFERSNCIYEVYFIDSPTTQKSHE